MIQRGLCPSSLLFFLTRNRPLGVIQLLEEEMKIKHESFVSSSHVEGEFL